MVLLIRAMRQFKFQFLEVLLAVTAMALAVMLVTLISILIDTNQQASRAFGQTLASRELYLTASSLGFVFPSGIDAVRIDNVPTDVPPLSLNDLEIIKDAIPAVAFAYYKQEEFLLKADWAERDALSALAVTEEYLAAANIEVVTGNLPHRKDFAEGHRVILISKKAIGRLGLEGNPLGQRLTFDGMPSSPTFTIVGILSEAITSSFVDTEIHALFPYKSYFRRLSVSEKVPWQVPSLIFAVEHESILDEALSQLSVYAENRFGEGRFTVQTARNPGQLLPQQHLTGLIIAVFTAIGCILAAFNIMNLMLARVLRHYRNIGIQRSLGADQAYIRRLFIVESLTLNLIGGCLGVLLCLSFIWWYNKFLISLNQFTTSQVGFGIEPSGKAMLVGILLAVGVSMPFSLYFALRASRLPIVEAIGDDHRDMLISTSSVHWLRMFSLRKALMGIQPAFGALVMSLVLSGYTDELRSGSGESFYLVARPEDSTARVALFDEIDVPTLHSLAPAVAELTVYDLNPTASAEVVRGGERFALRNAARVGSSYFDIARIELVEGSFFTDEDARQQATVVVISQDAARVIFDREAGESAIGQEVVVSALARGAQWRGRIIGVFRPPVYPTEASSFLTTMPALFYPSWLPGMLGSKFTTLVVVPRVGQEREAREQLLIAARHHYRGVRIVGGVIGEDFDNFFAIEDIDSTEFFNPTTIIVSLFAAIALTISLIGIFSSTVLGVSHDARAIGMKRALGASRRQLTLAFVKGAVGTALVAGTLGVGLAALLIPWLKAQAGTAFVGNLELRFEPWIGIVVVLLVVLVNAGLGLVPARQISRGQPAEALREG
jgi:putative ABC transport system permease protein